MTVGVRLLWILACGMLAGGAFCLESHYERTIGTSKATIETLYRDTVRNETIVAHADTLRAVQTAAERELRSISREHSLAAATASLLVTLQQTARRCHVDVLALQPGATTKERRLAATDLSLRVRGRFSDILAFLQDVPSHDNIISVSRTDLVLASDAGSAREPNLDATVHATLYRLQGEEKAVASAR
jgi:Tfp pilus assembly protein PilO